MLRLPYIVDQGQAGDVLRLSLEVMGVSRLLPELSGGYFLTDLERGDVVAFGQDDFAKTDFLTAALLSLVEGEKNLFRIIDKTYRPDGAQQIELSQILYPVFKKSLSGVYDVLVQKTVQGVSDILAQKAIQGVSDILAQKPLSGAFDILAQKSVSGVYDIKSVSDVWGDADVWGDSDIWGGAI